jgi:rhodanese-related sulfurtransferase
MFGFLKNLFGPGTDFKSLLSKGAIIVDVRTPEEYQSGHINGARNIPLDRIKTIVPEFKKTGKPVITCCRSGARSGMAKSQLAAAGIEAYNGGAWTSLNNKIK